MVLFLSIYGCEKAKTSIGDMEFPNGAVQHVVLANEITWKPCPPNLPSGCEMAVLEGNPQEPNFFTVRFRNRDSTNITVDAALAPFSSNSTMVS